MSHSGNLMPHRVGKVRCVGSGFPASQMDGHQALLRTILPGADLAERFKKK